MGGGCITGTTGTQCWGTWWVPLIFLVVALVIVIVLIGGLVSIMCQPRDALSYYTSKRNLVILPLTLIGCMAAWLLTQWVIWATRPALWVALLTAIVPATLLALGLRAMRRADR